MRKITAGLFISLDGVIEAPHEWHFPYWSDEMGEAVESQMSGADSMLLGRVTYEEFASYWPEQSEDEMEVAGYMNNTPKFVVTTTLDTLEWQNSTRIDGNNLAAEIKRLKEQPGKNIGITGSGMLVRSLLRENLLDELHLLVHPVVVGDGKKRLFPEKEGQLPLKLIDSRTLSNGVLYLTYGSADS